ETSHSCSLWGFLRIQGRGPAAGTVAEDGATRPSPWPRRDVLCRSGCRPRTEHWGERPWASSRATAPVTWGAAIEVPASQPYWLCLSFSQYVDHTLWVSSPSEAPPGATMAHLALPVGLE